MAEEQKEKYELGDRVLMECDAGMQVTYGSPYIRCAYRGGDGYWDGLEELECKGT
jgi:hypothetical protein